MKNVFPWIGLAVIVGLLGYVVSLRLNQENQAESSENRIQVAASFYPLAHIAEQIGGEYVNVTNLTPAGSEPHDFDPSPRDIAALQDSNVFLYNGLGLEPWVFRVKQELQANGVRVIDVSEGLETISNDPHTWLDPVLVKQQVQRVAEVFAEVDSAHASVYHDNSIVYTQELKTLHEEFETSLATCKRRDIVTTHAAFGYLTKRYTLNMIPISGLSPDAEASPARLAEVSRLVKEQGITHIFFETLVSPSVAETIARETGAKVLSLNPLEGLTSEEVQQGKTYLSVQRENLEALRIALDCV